MRLVRRHAQSRKLTAQFVGNRSAMSVGMSGWNIGHIIALALTVHSLFAWNVETPRSFSKQGQTAVTKRPLGVF